ncbi:unnamed protein product [Ilex paraguariensis]|uniref:Cytochrome P450 n=2 Tax=Ilex paraguariensis TaxID=185542 RepID=A0ABC8T1P2_9AQUA
MAVFVLFMLWRFLYSCWVLPNQAYQKLRRNGFSGPTPSFPLGNIADMKKSLRSSSSSSSLSIRHDIHSRVFPYFSLWQKLHGKVFIYWLGTEPFLYIADPEFLRKISAGVMGKSWGKPTVFKNDRKPMFGYVKHDGGINHKHARSVDGPNHLWKARNRRGDRNHEHSRRDHSEDELRNELRKRKEVFKKLRAMQMALFKYTRYVGVPFSNFMCPYQNSEAKKLGKEIDAMLLSIITSRKSNVGQPQKDLLSLLMAESQVGGSSEKKLTTSELVDECKTFFFAGHETTALALTWTLLLLAMHTEWQNQLREEVKEVIGDGEIDATMLARLKKMGWVMNEVLRLYSPAPNVQRQAREDIRVDGAVIPSGTNMWIDLVSMNHDRSLWGDDVYEFKPERFKDDSLYGGCKHKMGFLPFGFGGRMCVGRNLSMLEYKIVLTLILTRFSFSLSPNYCHSPSIMLSLRPTQGLPLIFQQL